MSPIATPYGVFLGGFMFDFKILPFDFAATTVTFLAISQTAKSRFDGAISVDVRKSCAQDFCDKLEAEGFKVAA